MIDATGKLAEIVKTLSGGGRLLILTHNNPDPDSIAAAFALRHILSFVTKMKSKLGYGGTIGRAENRAMVKLLRIPFYPMTAPMASRFKHIAIVDAQPGAKNVLVTRKTECDIVIDHHIPVKAGRSKFKDLRQHYGSTSTILTEYIKENQIPLNARVATALFYGIRTDVDDLGRGSSDYDFKMMHYLFPFVSLKWLKRIENAPIPIHYLRHYTEGLTKAAIYKDVVTADLGTITSPEAVAELADFLLKIEGMRWSLVYGQKENRLFFSIRTRRKTTSAGILAVQLAGKKGSAGGHDRSAGGYIELDVVTPEKIPEIKKETERKFLKRLDRLKANKTTLVEKASQPPS